MHLLVLCNIKYKYLQSPTQYINIALVHITYKKRISMQYNSAASILYFSLRTSLRIQIILVPYSSSKDEDHHRREMKSFHTFQTFHTCIKLAVLRNNFAFYTLVCRVRINYLKPCAKETGIW
jgi:hypothetical protein